MNRRKRRVGPSNGANKEGEELPFPFDSPFKFQELPSDIAIDILSRLTVKNIFNCRCVCKEWLRLISSPRFVELQLARSPIVILLKTMPGSRQSRHINVIHVEENENASQWDAKMVDKMKFTPRNNLPISNFNLVNSCNGLLCISGSEREEPLYVCNPILGEYIAIPSANKGRRSSSCVGLGYCALTNQYKIVQSFYPKKESNCCKTEVYTIGTGTWRSIENAPNALDSLPFNSFLHGALHWPACSTSTEFIYSFNFETEKFGVVPEPSFFNRTDRDLFDILKIGVLSGCLFLCYFGDDSSCFEIWVMKEYGVQESWTKLIVIDNLCPAELKNDVYEPVQFLSNGEILMVCNDEDTCCYNPKTDLLRYTRFTRTRFYFIVSSYTPSFVSLYYVGEGEQVERVRKSTKCKKLSIGGINEHVGIGQHDVTHQSLQDLMQLSEGFGSLPFEDFSISAGKCCTGSISINFAKSKHFYP